MIMTNWWYAAITIFVVMAMPGPAMLLGLAVATQHGVRRSLYVGGGVLAAFSVFAFLSLSGIGALVLADPAVLTVLRWFGVGYLAWLGALRSAPAGCRVHVVCDAWCPGAWIRSQFTDNTMAASVERDGLLHGSWHAGSKTLTA